MKVSQLGRPLLRGHVWLLEFEPFDPDRDGLIKKYGVILQEGDYFNNYEAVCVILLTTTPPLKPRATDVLIPQEEHGEEDKEVWANCGQVYTIPIKNLVEYKYLLSAETMEEIDIGLTIGLCMV